MRALQGYTLSRRDDLEGLGYSIMSLIPNNDGLPWDNIDDRNELCESKRRFVNSSNAETPEMFRALRKFIKTACDLKYTEEPDYS